MPTEFLREKINMLANMVQGAELQRYQAQLVVDIAAATSGDAQVDQALQGEATNAKAQMLAYARRLAVYREQHDSLMVELNAATPS